MEVAEVTSLFLLQGKEIQLSLKGRNLKAVKENVPPALNWAVELIVARGHRRQVFGEVMEGAMLAGVTRVATAAAAKLGGKQTNFGKGTGPGRAQSSLSRHSPGAAGGRGTGAVVQFPGGTTPGGVSSPPRAPCRGIPRTAPAPSSPVLLLTGSADL